MTKGFTLLVMLLFTALISGAQTGVAVNKDGATANTSAILDVSSTTKGMLISRMTQSQLKAIAQPANGLMVFNTDDEKLYIYYSSDNKWQPVAYYTGTWDVVTSTGKIWMDRNLGATEVATAKDDANAYGDLYQWGRAAEGHEKRNSSAYDGATNGLANTSTPNQGNLWDGKFITVADATPYDWLSPKDDNLWQGKDGINNPCPPGFRLPTETEWNDESSGWSNDADASGSDLKLTDAGYRSETDASLTGEGTEGNYWSSTVSGDYVKALHFTSTAVYIGDKRRAQGASVRCIKD